MLLHGMLGCACACFALCDGGSGMQISRLKFPHHYLYRYVPHETCPIACSAIDVIRFAGIASSSTHTILLYFL